MYCLIILLVLQCVLLRGLTLWSLRTLKLAEEREGSWQQIIHVD